MQDGIQGGMHPSSNGQHDGKHVTVLIHCHESPRSQVCAGSSTHRIRNHPHSAAHATASGMRYHSSITNCVDHASKQFVQYLQPR